MNKFEETYRKIILEENNNENLTPEEQKWLDDNGFKSDEKFGGYKKDWEIGNNIDIKSILCFKKEDGSWVMTAIGLGGPGKRFSFGNSPRRGEQGKGIGKTPAEAFKNMVSSEIELTVLAIRGVGQILKIFEDYKISLDEILQQEYKKDLKNE